MSKRGATTSTDVSVLDRFEVRPATMKTEANIYPVESAQLFGSKEAAATVKS